MTLIRLSGRSVGLAALCFLVVILAACSAPEPDAEPKKLTIYAAASLREVVDELASAYIAEHGGYLTLNFAGSNTLAQQIRSAPGADVFLSADEDWLRFLEAQGRTVPGSARPVLGNRLAVIARAGAAQAWTDLSAFREADFEGLVLADPDAVPAGRYARAALQHLDPELWSELGPRVVPALNARAALQLVASEPRLLGIVYRTDAQTSTEVEVLYELPALDAVPVVYWAACIPGGGNQQAGCEFLDFMAGAEAKAIYGRHGFPAP